MTNKPQFEIKASVVKQLGLELISDEITALLELVKNSYDADASFVSIKVNTKDLYRDKFSAFEDSDKTGIKPGFIIIEDDGTGMNRFDIDNGWLTLSVSQKKLQKSYKCVTVMDPKNWTIEKVGYRLTERGPQNGQTQEIYTRI